MEFSEKFIEQTKEYDERYLNLTIEDLSDGKKHYDEMSDEINPDDVLNEKQLLNLGFYIMYKTFEETDGLEVDPNFFNDIDDDID